MGAVAGGTPVLYKSLGMQYAGGVFIAAIVLLYFAMQVYDRCDAHAAYALDVASIYEMHDDPTVKPFVAGMRFHGPAHGFFNRDVYAMRTEASGRIYRMVRAFFVGTAIVFALLACATLYHDVVVAPSKADMEKGHFKLNVQNLELKLQDAPQPGSDAAPPAGQAARP